MEYLNYKKNRNGRVNPKEKTCFLHYILWHAMIKNYKDDTDAFNKIKKLIVTNFLEANFLRKIEKIIT